MPTFRIPDDLARMLADRRVIPFLGAGFSAVQGLPDWSALLKDVAEEVQSDTGDEPPLTYAEIAKACGDDNLQIAEYLYLRAGNSIGPIRHVMTKALQRAGHPLESSTHVELVNLGATQVYTTNFDDLIEDTYHALNLPVEVIALPRNLAQSHYERTQVVKYHGDLRHDVTLVLTEAQYYARLDFESPMDLKFRSDLLGRAVLFMGYSFRDINIRVIWFKLMEMMKDVPVKDRPPSYIVRLAPNPVLDALYEAVGLRTITIDPENRAHTTDERSALLEEFMLALSIRAASTAQIPGTSRPMFVSPVLLRRIEEAIQDLAATSSGRFRGFRRSLSGQALPDRFVPSAELLGSLEQLALREVPSHQLAAAQATLGLIARAVELRSSVSILVALVARFSEYGPSSGLTYLVSEALMNAPSRAALLAESLPWDVIWAGRIAPEDAHTLVAQIGTEVDGHVRGGYQDEDVAYAIDLAQRIARGQLVEGSPGELMDEVQQLMHGLAEIYPSAASYEPPTDCPAPAEICNEIAQRIEARSKRAEDEEAGSIEI